MKNIRSITKTLIVIFSVIYFFIVAILPITFVIGVTDGGDTLQNYFGFVFEFFTWTTPIFLFLLFAILLLKAYLLYRHSEIGRTKFIRQAVLFSILILLQIILFIGMIVWSNHMLHGALTAIE